MRPARAQIPGHRKDESNMNYKRIKELMQSTAIHQALNYAEGDPQTNIPRLMELVDRLVPEDWYASQRNAIRSAIE